MKRLLLSAFALLLILVSCNLDSSTGIFEQIYNETEKNNVTVSYMIGKESDSYYFSTKENGLAKASSPFERYNKVEFVDNLVARFIASNGYVICSDRENGKYYALAFVGSSKEEIKITATANNIPSIIEGAYFNGNPGTGKMLTVILKSTDGDYFFYTGDQPTYNAETKSVDFSSATQIEGIPDSSAPQIIGPGKYTFMTYIEDVDQTKWIINDITSVEFSSRPILCIDGLVILENGNTYVPDSYSNFVDDIGDYSNFTGNRVIASGVDQTGKIYGITDECSFSYNPSATENAFKYNPATTNSIHVGLIFDSDKIKVATTENGIKEFNTSSL